MLAVLLFAAAVSVATEPTTVLILPIEPRQAELKETAELTTALMSGEVRKVLGYRVVTYREMEGAMSIEQRRQVTGCDSASCAAEIAGALNSDEIILETLGRVGAGNFVLSLSRIAARSASVVGSSVRRIAATDEGAILDVLPSVVRELFGAGGLGLRASAPQPAIPPSSDATQVPDDFISMETNAQGLMYPRKGPYKKELNWPEFYRAVGREELADKFMRSFYVRATLFWTGAVGGGVVFLASVAGMLGGIVLLPFINSNISPVPNIELRGVASIGSLSLVGGSVVIMLLGILGAGALIGASALYPAHLAEEAELRQMADEHNRKLGARGPPAPPATSG